MLNFKLSLSAMILGLLSAASSMAEVRCPAWLISRLQPGQCACSAFTVGQVYPMWGVMRGRSPGVIELTTGFSGSLDWCRQMIRADHRPDTQCLQEIIVDWSATTESCVY